MATFTETFSVSGTWVAPSDVTSVDKVECWGGGGAGGGKTANGGGGGGGGGAYAASTSVAVTAGQSYAVAVGGGGAATTGDGGTGGNSTFNSTTVVAAGGIGGGGGAGSSEAGGAGGTTAASTGGTKAAGGAGGATTIATDGGGGGGESGGTNGTGGAGQAGTVATGGAGGTGVNTDGGDGGAGTGVLEGAGNPGVVPGGGGGGAYRTATNETGGAGAKGQVKITYTTTAQTGSFANLTGSFAAPGVTGNVQVGGLGFTPKAIMFWGTKLTSSTDAGTASYYFVGFATSSSSQVAICPDLTNDKTGTVTASSIFLQNNNVVDIAATIVSFDATGFTVNFTTGDVTTAGYLIFFQAFGGSDVTNATIKTFQAPAGTGNQAYTGVGFKPDFAYFMTANDTTVAPHNNSQLTYYMGFGAAASATQRFTLSSSFASTASTYQRTVKCLSVIGDTVLVEADLTTFDSDGFTLNYSTTRNGVYAFALCLKGGQYAIGSFNQPTSTGNVSVTGLPFQPVGETTASFMKAAATTVQQGTANDNGAGWMLGAMSSASNRLVLARSYIGTPIFLDKFIVNRATVVRMYGITQGSTTIAATADFSSQNSDGFTINFTSADSIARQVVYAAFGSANATTVIKRLAALGVG